MATATAEVPPEVLDPDPQGQTSTALAAAPRRSNLGIPARFDWDSDQVEAIKRTVAKECSPAQFVMFLELAARYELDPFARQIWAAKMGNDQDDVAILIGRDGLLSIAERRDTFEGMESDVVVEGDKLTRDKATGEYVHEWGEDHLTGKVIGAWAMVHRSDRAKPICFYARWDEYAKENSKFWRKFKSAMMVKCAESMALKRSYSISGFVVEEEASPMLEAGALNRADTIEWGDDPNLSAWLQALVARANEVRKNAYRPQKVLALLKGTSDQERRKFAEEVVGFINGRDGEVPDPPKALAAMAEDGTVLWAFEDTTATEEGLDELPATGSVRDEG